MIVTGRRDDGRHGTHVPAVRPYRPLARHRRRVAGPACPHVPQPTTGSAILTWQPPALNTDGSPLADLAAFKVYWGTTQGTYSQSTKISNAAARTYTVSGLTKGTWYFVVTALNAQGLESPYSNVWSKTADLIVWPRLAQ